MLVLRPVGENAVGEWSEFEVRGTTVELQIRPLTAEVLESIRKKYKKTRREKDRDTGNTSTVIEYDEDKVSDDLIDYVLESFKGFGSDPKTELEVTVENKKRIMELPPIADEQTISEFVFDTAREIAAVSEKEVQAKVKKSQRLLDGCMAGVVSNTAGNASQLLK